MSTKHTISINGQIYDAVTGLPVGADVSNAAAEKTTKAPQENSRNHPNAHREPTHPSNSMHHRLQKSTTLRRGHLKTPKNETGVSAPKRHEAGHTARSPMISHFADHPQPLPKHHTPKMINDIGPTARQAVSAPSTRKQLSSHEVKQRLIADAGVKVDRQLAAKAKSHSDQPKRQPLLKRLRKSHLVTAAIAALLLAGYLTYLNVPGLSVRLAAAQAGVNAQYPTYNPDGYSFRGPVAYQPGEVELRFNSNSTSTGYTIRQQNSDWNSDAVLDNLVNKKSNGNYSRASVNGITVYTYGTRAAWTNGGVLYQVDGDAPLSNDQLLKIAASL